MKIWILASGFALSMGYGLPFGTKVECRMAQAELAHTLTGPRIEKCHGLKRTEEHERFFQELEAARRALFRERMRQQIEALNRLMFDE